MIRARVTSIRIIRTRTPISQVSSLRENKSIEKFSTFPSQLEGSEEKPYLDIDIFEEDLPTALNKLGHHQQQELSYPLENCRNSYLHLLNAF